MHASLKRLVDCPKLESENAPEATLRILAEFVEVDSDIKKGQEQILFTWLHFGNRTTFQYHLRDNPNSSLTGVFSTRSPDRPNPTGVHIVKVVLIIEKVLLKVNNLEALDQTPNRCKTIFSRGIAIGRYSVWKLKKERVSWSVKWLIIN